MRAPFVSCLAMVLLAGCTSSTAPSSIVGTYRSSTIDGSLGPVRYDSQNHNPAAPWITGATLEVTPTDTMWLTIRLAAGSDPFAPTDTSSERWFYIYQVIGDSIALDFSSTLFARIDRGRIRLNLVFPTPPSDGMLITHEFLFAR